MNAQEAKKLAATSLAKILTVNYPDIQKDFENRIVNTSSQGCASFCHALSPPFNHPSVLAKLKAHFKELGYDFSAQEMHSGAVISLDWSK